MNTKKEGLDEAVSPVVGVMLMLVVTIIIAAVVSAFAGGLASSQQKAPQLTAETKIVNTGYYYGSYFSMAVTGVSESISSSDLKLVTSWKKGDYMNSTTVVAGTENFNYSSGGQHGIAPWATGVGTTFGVNNNKDVSQWYGNFTLTTGTQMRAYPSGLWGPGSNSTKGGYGPDVATYEYFPGSSYVETDIDPMQAVLGYNWNQLREGDKVNVKIIHIPSGKTIYESDVAVRSG